MQPFRQYRNYYLTLIALFVLTVLEILCQVAWYKIFDPGAVSLFYMLFGLLIGIIPLIKVERPLPSEKSPKVHKIAWGISALMFLYLLGRTLMMSKRMVDGTPVDYRLADMLPIMQIMSERYINGRDVYAIIPEIWGGMLPIYLPTMWMPYIPSVIWHFDPRWITVFFLVACTALIMLIPAGKKRFTWGSLFILLPAYLMFDNFLYWDKSLITLTDEGVVVGFYVFLAWAIWLGNPWVLGIALTLSILSRVSYVNWIPFYAIFVWLFESRRKAIQVAITAISLGVFLMWNSTALWHLDIFLDLPRRYLEAVMNTEHYEKTLRSGIVATVGLAKFFRQEYFPLLLRASYFTTIVAPLTCLILFWRFRRHMDAKLFGIASLKITLVFFFNLLILPQSNLFYTSGFLSLAILAFYAQERPKPVKIFE